VVSGEQLGPILLIFLIVNALLLLESGARRLLPGRSEAVVGPGRDGPHPPGRRAAVEPGVAEPTAGEWSAANMQAAPVDPMRPDAGQPDAAPLHPDEPTDPLDAEGWSRLLAGESRRAARYRRPVAIVSIELLGLEELSARLGDEAVGRLLPAMGDTLRRLARETDHVACLGPGVFGVLMPESDDDAAASYVRRVRRACDRWLGSGAHHLGLAAGSASAGSDRDLVATHRLAVVRMRERRRDDGSPEHADSRGQGREHTGKKPRKDRRGRKASKRHQGRDERDR
jgi:GGDEF domain-containing protein